MSGNPLRTMSIAVNYNRIGFCYLVGKQPMDWQLTFKAATTTKNAEKKIKEWIEFYCPDIVITEDPKSLRRKGDRARMLLDIAKRVAEQADVQHIEIQRIQPHRNLYDRIDELCEKYPQLKAAKPRRRKYYQKEPPYVTIFDAASMADELHS